MFSRLGFGFLGLLMVFCIELVFSALIQGLEVLEGLDLGFVWVLTGFMACFGGFWGFEGCSGVGVL